MWTSVSPWREGKAGGRTPGGGARVHVHFTCRVHRGGRAWQMDVLAIWHGMPVTFKKRGFTIRWITWRAIALPAPTLRIVCLVL